MEAMQLFYSKLLSYAIFSFALSVVLSLSAAAHAGFIISFSTDGRSNTVFTIAPGAPSQSIPVYLVQIGNENRLLDVGAFSAGTTIQFSGGVGASTYVANSASIPAPWAERLLNFDSADNSLLLQSATDGSPFRGSFLQIGSFQMSAGADGNSTTLTASVTRNIADANMLIDLTEILPSAANSENRLTFGTATVITAVPEPSSLLLGAFAASGIAASAWRRRKQRTKSSSTLESTQ